MGNEHDQPRVEGAPRSDLLDALSTAHHSSSENSQRGVNFSGDFTPQIKIDLLSNNTNHELKSEVSDRSTRMIPQRNHSGQHRRYVLTVNGHFSSAAQEATGKSTMNSRAWRIYSGAATSISGKAPLVRKFDTHLAVPV